MAMEKSVLSKTYNLTCCSIGHKKSLFQNRLNFGDFLVIFLMEQEHVQKNALKPATSTEQIEKNALKPATQNIQ